VLENISLQEFGTDWQRQWLVERGIEIISEASRHLTDEMKARHPEIPWQKVAAIGNVPRHNHENIAAPIIRKLAQADLPALQNPPDLQTTAPHSRRSRSFGGAPSGTPEGDKFDILVTLVETYEERRCGH
jgi:uncharacterized protein with HEPN domain